VQKVNRVILAIEGIPLAYLSILGFMLAGGGILPAITGSRRSEDLISLPVGVLIAVGLIAGWRLLIAYVAHGPSYARDGMRIWWSIACCMILLSLVGVAWPHSVFELFRLGVFFVPTFIHLAISVWGGLLPNFRWSGP
jgi:hypothetical protein